MIIIKRITTAGIQPRIGQNNTCLHEQLAVSYLLSLTGCIFVRKHSDFWTIVRWNWLFPKHNDIYLFQFHSLNSVHGIIQKYKMLTRYIQVLLCNPLIILDHINKSYSLWICEFKLIKLYYFALSKIEHLRRMSYFLFFSSQFHIFAGTDFSEIPSKEKSISALALQPESFHNEKHIFFLFMEQDTQNEHFQTFLLVENVHKHLFVVSSL